MSFISLAKVLGPVLGCLARGYDVLALVKPQFEVGRARVGKGGVVRDADHRREALVAVGEAALECGAAVLGYHSSGLPGPKGNRETFIWLSDPARVTGAPDRRSLSWRARAAGRSRAVREITVLTHRPPDETGGTLARLVTEAARAGVTLRLDEEETRKHACRHGRG